MSSPTFGLGTRSSSPSMLLNSPLRNNSGYISHGPSIQSLVKSFINKVSRGTQTDCDDNFDQMSIASMTSGFSALATDLTRSRLNLFLNDKSTASTFDDNEFVEELQKLRDQIDTRFGLDYTENEFADMTSTSVSRQGSLKRKGKQTCEQFVETNRLITEDAGIQTDQLRRPTFRTISTQQTPDMVVNQTQTETKNICPHCSSVLNGKDTGSDRIQLIQNNNEQKPLIKWEFLISVSVIPNNL